MGTDVTRIVTKRKKASVYVSVTDEQLEKFPFWVAGHNRKETEEEINKRKNEKKNNGTALTPEDDVPKWFLKIGKVFLAPSTFEADLSSWAPNTTTTTNSSSDGTTSTSAVATASGGTKKSQSIKSSVSKTPSSTKGAKGKGKGK
ncbi:hypothetical protein DFA_11152 [Cavenderia fasciculata]|uniref:Uncharacterized protein n=1 Tax=Cavenderia fasciculata TaxID=261658 RepID=F4QF32_CACFS|nr:uncharacterized protein DFA_11152 [Cavenderia fasciculata]EGG13391.1 hypothetical protein DFA_11152 [Cavenderia fasciculata]|eukprot:XP_004350095.1 hypothetical protein DFA_11152 [Cavenderia fasciculata]